MIAIILSAILLGLLTWVYLQWVNMKQFWRRRGVPHLPPHPILGSLTFLMQKNPGQWMMDMYQKFKSPYVGIWLFRRPALIINSPELAKKVLVKDFVYFRDRFLSSGSSDPLGGLNLFTTNDPLWSTLRRRLTSTFTSSKLKAMQPLVDIKSSELVQRVRNTEDKTKISLRYLFTDYTTDIFATAAFGIKTNATLTGIDPMRKITTAFMEFDLHRGISWISIFFFPRLVDIFRFKFFPKSATDYFQRVFKLVSEQRIKNRNPEPKDFLDVLLKMKEESINNNEELSNEIIVAQAAIFLLGGFETSGSVLSFVTYELAFHPEIQDKIYNELKEMEMESEDGNLDIGKLAKLPYLNAVVKEGLRRYSPMGWLDRVASMDYKLDDNLTIPAGTPVYINAIGMQHDPDIYKDPYTFNPDRFLSENEDNNQFTYMPFGEGPRNCIGKRFGQISLRHGISKLILNYTVIPVPGAPKPSEVQFEKRGLLLVPGEHLYVDFIPREYI